ncbi:MAG: nucleoside-diphosphate sugar epimerase/dehydratase [Pseudomonadota bacterium]
MIISQKIKLLIKLIADSVFIPLAIFWAFVIRFDSFDIISYYDTKLVIITTIASLITFVLMGFYRAIVRYMGHDAFLTIISSVTFSSFILVLVSNLFDIFLPRSIPFLYWAVLLCLVGGARLIVWNIHKHQARGKKKRIIIYGAGESGRMLLNSLENNGRYIAVAFIDNKIELQKHIVHGLKVYSPDKLEALIEDKKVSQIFLAIPSANRRKKKRIIQFLEPLSVHIKTIPDLSDILSGRAKVDEIKELDIEDLLGRQSIKLNHDLLEKCINNKVVLVTGAGGSIGSELCRQILKHHPSVLILYELSEFSLYQISQELEKLNTNSGTLVPLLGSVQDQKHLTRVFSHYKVNTVYHAAAYKHVPLVEENIVEGVRNNVFGSCKAAKAAIETKVETFVLISTDKAVRPTNIMGASKRLAEMLLQSMNDKMLAHQSTCFCMVRFGNVLGSSGSVVPLFKKQIYHGGPVTVTHPDIIRYFMTIPEAVQLVLQASAIAKGGDVFVLDMGEPVKIVDLAKKMIHLSGYEVKDRDNPEGDIQISYTGLRPGEKLYEELLIGNNVSGTGHPEIMRAEEDFLPYNEMEKILEQLYHACEEYKIEVIKEILLNNYIGYTPLNNDINDLLWCKMKQTVA